MRGLARYIEALPSTIPTQSQNAGMYAPPAADGPNRQHICGTRPESRTCRWKIADAPRWPGKKPSASVSRPPAESTRKKTGSRSRSARSRMRICFSNVRPPHEPALTDKSCAMTATRRPSTRPCR